MKSIISTYLILSLSFAAAYSSEAPSVEWDWNQTQLAQNIDTLQHNVQLLQSELPSNEHSESVNETTCTACLSQSSSSLDRLIPQVLSRGQPLIRKTSTFASLKRLLRTPIGRRRYRKRVAVSTLVSSLSVTTCQFAAWSARASQPGDHTAWNESTVTVELWRLIEAVATLSATLVNETSTLLLLHQDSSSGATAGLAASSVIAVLGFLERVTLATVSLVIDYTSVLTNMDQSENLESLSIKVSELQKALVVGSGFGALDGVVRFQTDQDDRYGLAESLGKMTMSMSSVGQNLARLVAEADSAISRMAESPLAELEPVMSREGIAEIIYLTSGMASTVLTSVVDIALELPTVTGRVLGSSLGLVVRSIESSFTGIVATFNSIARILQVDTNVSGDSVLFVLCRISSGGASYCNAFLFLIPALLLTPIWIPLLIASLVVVVIYELVSPNSRLVHTKEEMILTSCPMESLRCNKNVISNRLPII